MRKLLVLVALGAGACCDSGVAIMGMLNECPTISSAAAAPSSVPIGNPVALAATASDADAAEDTLAFRWTASAGSIDEVAAASTTYHCGAQEGPQAIAVTVSDASGCSVTAALVVTCRAAASSRPSAR